MKKISAIITLSKILERTKSKVELKSHGTRIMEITMIQSRSTQKFLLKDALRKFEIAFNIEVILSKRPYPGSSQTSILEL
jgi:exopolyphosphatase/guanosine-5'-triphosphate,3'-diphosphate pyrophosphatase